MDTQAPPGSKVCECSFGKVSHGRVAGGHGLPPGRGNITPAPARQQPDGQSHTLKTRIMSATGGASAAPAIPAWPDPAAETGQHRSRRAKASLHDKLITTEQVRAEALLRLLT